MNLNLRRIKNAAIINVIVLAAPFVSCPVKEIPSTA